MMNKNKWGSNKEDVWNDMDINEAELQKLLDEPFGEANNSNLRENKNHNGFDGNVGDTWIYPSNLPLRAYQLSIVQKALFENTLVVLPTGLGKTFIAAVVMYNIYRWYPKGKIIFMAPTRPLVAQQIEACHKIMPFPQKDTVELTGKITRLRRVELWKTKRVFFATPQVVQSDMTSEFEDGFKFPYADVKLVVFDEAHKAKGRYSYTEVTQRLLTQNEYFRVLALSATPGRSMEDVAEVVRNLLISHIEVRWDNSPDVIPYIHQRNMNTIVVPLSDDIRSVREELLTIIDPYMRQLIDFEVLSGSISKINRNYLIYEQKHFREACLQQRHPNQAAVNSNFSILITLYHALELLERHGLRVFVNYFEQDEEGNNNFVLNTNHQLRELVEDLRSKLGPNPFEYSTHTMTNGMIAQIPRNLDFGHPKFEEARKCLLEHFENNQDAQAIVFCEFRESVTLMHRLLLQHVPLLKPRCFVGQGGSGTGSSLKPLTQKQQIQIMKDFRSGVCNVLIATAVGEEGIDVGEVDMVVCFDISTTNPTRFIQRIGRTGRKKKGNVVMLVTEGKEHQLLKDVLSQKDFTIRRILTSQVVRGALYQHAPRLIPTELNPQCVHTFVQINEDVEEKSPTSESTIEMEKKKKKISEKQIKYLKGSQDLRKFFKKVPDLGPEEMEVFQKPTQSLSVNTQKRAEESFQKINNFFKDLDLSTVKIQTQASKNVIDPKKLRKVNKFLQKPPPIMSESQYSEDIKCHLNSKSLSKAAKLYILHRRPEYVREIVEKLKIINALGQDEDEVMGPEEIELRKSFETIEALFGCQQEIDEFLENQANEALKSNDILEFPDEDKKEISKKFQDKLDKVFADYKDLGPYNSSFDFIQEKLKEHAEFCKKIKREKENLTNPFLQSTAYNSVLESETSMQTQMNTPFTESKYLSQINESNKEHLRNASTPLSGISKKGFPRKPKSSFMEKSQNLTVLEKLAEESDLEDEDLSHYDFASKIENESNTKNNHVLPEDHLNEIENFDVVSMNSTPDDILNPITNEVSNIDEHAKARTSKSESCLDLSLIPDDIDLDDFLEPFPQETLANIEHEAKRIQESQKENFDGNQIPEVTKEHTIQNNLNINEKVESKETFPSNSTLFSPTQRKKIEKSFETSPSLFDLYVKKVRQRNLSQLQKSASKTEGPSRTLIDNNCSKDKHAFEDESIIVVTRKKRKILESDSESEKETDISHRDKASSNSDTSAEIKSEEEIVGETSIRPFKRRRLALNSFIEQEAGRSGSDTEDEMEHTIGCYMKDSIIVSSGDESDDASQTHMQAIYLNSLKSPQERRDGFKIPLMRVYNDHSRIFSQAVIEEEHTDYIPDSFVTSENDEEIHSKADQSLCPLEKAEKILKERRRAKRKNMQEVGMIQKRKKRKVFIIDNSSDNDFE